MRPLLHWSSVLIPLLAFACGRPEQEGAGSEAKTASQEKLRAAPTATAPSHRGAHALAPELPEPVPMSVKATGQLGPGRGTLIIDIKAPEGAELTEGAPFRVSAQGADLTFPEVINTKLDLKSLPARLPLDVADGAQGPIQLDLTYYYCTKGDDGSCRPERAKLNVEMDISGGSPGGEAHIVHQPDA